MLLGLGMVGRRLRPLRGRSHLKSYRDPRNLINFSCPDINFPRINPNLLMAIWWARGVFKRTFSMWTRCSGERKKGSAASWIENLIVMNWWFEPKTLRNPSTFVDHNRLASCEPAVAVRINNQITSRDGTKGLLVTSLLSAAEMMVLAVFGT